MRALLIFLAFGAVAMAQSSFDPYQFVDKKDLNNADVNRLWRMLGISGKIRETTVDGSKDTSETFSCGPDDLCEADLSRPHWSLLNANGDGQDVVVRISPRDNYYDLSRFLVVHLGKAGWQLVGYLDSTDSHYDSAAAAVINSGGKRWFVVNSYPRCGTGCSMDHSDWFELKNGKLQMVLTVPLSGHEIYDDPWRNFETRFVRANRLGASETLDFIYHVEFRSSVGSSIQVSRLWGEEKIIRFSRPIGQGEFKFDAKNSEASEAFANRIFSSRVARPQLFELIQDNLVRIARGPHDRRWEWLKEMLKQNPYLDELAPVRAAFASPRPATVPARRGGDESRGQR